MKIKYWIIAFIFIAGLIFCSQGLPLFPWPHIAGVLCLGTVALWANKLEGRKHG